MNGGDGGSSGGRSSASSSPTRPTHRLLPNIQTSTPPQQNAVPAAPSKLASQHAQPPPLLLTVRFSTGLPDLRVDILHPAQTTIAALKLTIRSRLTQPNSQRRLRFIHGGKVLSETAVIAAVLKPLPPPPKDAPLQQQQQQQSDPKGKGKAVEGRDDAAQRVYVICSIGDSLTDAELEEEKKLAEELVPEGAAAPSSSQRGGQDTRRPTTTDRGPRGFDRLLAAGFTPAEVNEVRLAHHSNLRGRHTADTLPSPDTLRNMEDAWLDNNHAGGVTAAAGPGVTEEGGAADGDEFGLAGVIDVLLQGMFIGFVWPLGALGWLVRGEEKIPKRMRVFVYFGAVLSILIGTVRVIG